MKAGRPSKAVIHQYDGISAAGAWTDVGDGACQRCEERRRLYRPITNISLNLCATCTQVVAAFVLGDRQVAS